MSATPNVLAVIDDNGDALLADLRAIIASGRERASTTVNAEIVATYWTMGERVAHEEQHGAERAGSCTQGGG